MVRRNRSVAFMGGAYVFPGGRVDDGDAVTATDGPPASTAWSRWRAAPTCRATTRRRFAWPRSASCSKRPACCWPVATAGSWTAGTAARLRHAAGEGAAVSAVLAAAHGLRLALDAVMPFAHWVTPPVEIRRFDTRFLMARAARGPAGQPRRGRDDGARMAASGRGRGPRRPRRDPAAAADVDDAQAAGAVRVGGRGLAVGGRRRQSSASSPGSRARAG